MHKGSQEFGDMFHINSILTTSSEELMAHYHKNKQISLRQVFHFLTVQREVNIKSKPKNLVKPIQVMKIENKFILHEYWRQIS